MNLTASKIAEMINGVTSCIPRPDGSLPDVWGDLSELQQLHAINAVKEIYASPPRTPKELHDLWMKPLMEHGWTAGEFNKENKCHPCLVPFEDLPHSEILKDRIWQSLTELFREFCSE